MSSVGDNTTVCTAPPDTTAVASLDAALALPAASRAITLYTQVPTGRAASENVVPDATVPIFVVASAVNPAVADRYTSYPATPTASVDAVHVNATVVPDTFACNAVGTVGAVVSAGAATTADA